MRRLMLRRFGCRQAPGLTPKVVIPKGGPVLGLQRVTRDLHRNGNPVWRDALIGVDTALAVAVNPEWSFRCRANRQDYPIFIARRRNPLVCHHRFSQLESELYCSVFSLSQVHPQWELVLHILRPRLKAFVKD